MDAPDHEHTTVAATATAPYVAGTAPTAKEFSYVSPDFKFPAEQHPTPRVFIVITVLTLLLLGAILFWYYSFQAPPKLTSAADTATAYLSALTAGDISTQQQLASNASKGLLLPSWLVVVTGEEKSANTVHDLSGELAVVLQVAPAPDTDAVSGQALTQALSRSYQVTLPLVFESGSWRVDQQTFFQALHREMQQQNPGVKFPSWE